MAELGLVTLQKRKGARSLRLTVGHDGRARVSMPHWTPYKAAEAFVLSKRGWIIEQQTGRPVVVLRPGQRIGKGHRLRFVQEERMAINSRVTQTELIIRIPPHHAVTDEAVQVVARAGAIRALKQEANKLLPMRLKILASQHGFGYRKVSIKRLKSRWGSCSSQKDIALNCFLIQLPWDLIDYVLLHELLHTQIMAHGGKFWSELSQYVSDLPAKRKTIKAHQPALVSQL